MTPCDLIAEAHGTQLTRVVWVGKDCSDLPSLVYPDGTVLTEWALTDEERAQLLAGERIRLWLHIGGRPLPPLALEVTREHVA